MRIPSPSSNLTRLPPYLFVRLNSLKDQAQARGISLIDLGMGNPDLPSPEHVVERACESLRAEPWTHRYPQTKGLSEFRNAIADWYRRRFGVSLDPEKEVLPLIGSKEGLAHLCFAYLSSRDVALVPSPCYPVHYNGVLLSGARAHLMPLRPERGFLPDLESVPSRTAKRAKLLILNYPNNPTGAVVEDVRLFEQAIRFARRNRCLVLHDNAYSELAFDGYRAPSFLQLPEAKEVGVEFHSLSKTYSMAGWRVAFVAGNSQVIEHLSKFKSFLDYGIPGFLQRAGTAALSGPQDYVPNLIQTYRSRRDTLVQALNRLGWNVVAPKATMYVWGKLPPPFGRWGSLKFAEKLILEEGVVLAPGIGFGPYGEGYMRFALVVPEKQILEAASRMENFFKRTSKKAPLRPSVALGPVK